MIEKLNSGLCFADELDTKSTFSCGKYTSYHIVKRIFDILVSFAACVFLLLPSLCIMLLICFDSKGSPIFKQERLGVGGKPFMIYKFRTMRTDAEANGPQFATDNDVRCTRVGRYLRKLRIDEWPQFYNILIGDMSLVGPRPERACYYNQFINSIPEFCTRLCAKPGLTGYAQVFGGLKLQPQDKIKFDLEYIKNQCVRLDLQCILKTFSLLWKLMVKSNAE